MRLFFRMYHVSTNCYSNITKQSAKLCKMINPKPKRQWYPTLNRESDRMPTLKSLTKTNKEPGKQGIRRMAVLNKLFMKHITDIMSTGTVAINIVGHGIEISKVQITPDFQTVNVFWVCKGEGVDDKTQALLTEIAGALRHELSTLRIMGEVPYIDFVKDKHESRIVDLDRRLALADYGEDYTPTEMGHFLKTEFTLNTKLSPEMKAKIKQLEDDLPITEELIPEMTHNVYGLDHAKIMNRLLAARKMNKDAWSNLDVATSVISYRTQADITQEIDNGKQKEELAEFLLKRQILQNKLHKQMRSSRETWEVDFDERNSDKDEMHNDDDDDDYYEDDEDYYEEKLHIEDDKKNDPNEV